MILSDDGGWLAAKACAQGAALHVKSCLYPLRLPFLLPTILPRRAGAARKMRFSVLVIAGSGRPAQVSRHSQAAEQLRPRPYEQPGQCGADKLVALRIGVVVLRHQVIESAAITLEPSQAVD